MSSNLQIPKVCQHCGIAFIARTTVTKFCSANCSKLNYKKRKREEKIQNTLKAEIQVKQDQVSPTLSNSKNISSKEFLSIQEAADMLGASRWTIQRMIKNSKITHAKIGRRTIIKRSEIDKLFK